MRILAFDTSCDETSIAIVEGRRILAQAIYSQVLTHTTWGGVVPNLARKEHEDHLPLVLETVLKKYARYLARTQGVQISYKDEQALFTQIDAIAVTQGPGLAIALETGILFTRALSARYRKPLIPVHHMAGHLYAVYAHNSAGNPPRDILFPALGILASGGHTELVLWRDHGSYEILSETLDDAAGEALDKAAKMLGLGYPGAPVIERLAAEAGNNDTYRFPRAMQSKKLRDMSFSGLKTAFYYYIKQNPTYDLRQIASSIQEAVFDTLFIKVKRNLAMHPVRAIVCGGGVVVNRRFRAKLRQIVRALPECIPVYYPPEKYLCGDNAAMIGIAASFDPRATDQFDRLPRVSLEAWGRR